MGNRARITWSTALMAAVILMVPVAGGADPLDLPPIISDPAPSPSPSPTSSPSRSSGSKDGGSTSSRERDASKSSSRSSGSSKDAAGPQREVDGETAKAIRLWTDRERTPARTTTDLLELIARAQPDGDEPTPSELRAGFGRFPVVGYVWYQDDYGAPRWRGYYNFHEGTDIFAERGTPVTAVTDGYIWQMGSYSRGGNAIWLMGDDGVRYYYGHLHRFAKGLKTGHRVAQGDVIGSVGDTGNAKGTYPHVHFEVNPGGLGTVNPKPLLDAWLNNAETRIRQRLVATLERDELARFGSARWDLLVDLMAEPVAVPPALWTAGFGVAGGTLAWADMALADLLAANDWDALVGSAGPAGASGQDAGVFFDPVRALQAASD